MMARLEGSDLWPVTSDSDLTPSCFLSSPLLSAVHPWTPHLCPPAILFVSALFFQPICLRLSLALLSSLASVAVQYGLVVSAGTKAPLSGERIQWNEGFCKTLHCSMHSSSIKGHFLQAGERSGSTAWGSESPGFTPSWWLQSTLSPT